MARENPIGRRLIPKELIQVSDGIIDPTVEQILVYRDWYEGRLGVIIIREEVVARLRHSASLNALLRGHERPRPEGRRKVD